MNKLLNIIKVLLLFVLIFVNFWGLKNEFQMLGYNHVFYLILVTIILIVTIKDWIKKDTISTNKIFNILSIAVFLIMIFILLRAMYDTRFIYNNSEFVKDLNIYGKNLYGFKANYEDFMTIDFFVAQNINYFIMMLMLVLGYRFINKDKNKV